MMEGMDRSSLASIFAFYGTDKVDYAAAYQAVLEPRRASISTVMEIGIGTLRPTAESSMVGWAAPHYTPGGSLRSWRDFFPNAIVFGFDTEPDTQFSEKRIKTFLCDSTEVEQVQAIFERQQLPRADLVVDDGSHRAEDQIETFRNFFPRLGPGGIYIIEDVIPSRPFPAIAELVGTNPAFFVGEEGNPIVIFKASA
jgi:hypothetical protein